MASVLSAIDGHGQKKMLVNLAGKYFGKCSRRKYVGKLAGKCQKIWQDLFGDLKRTWVRLEGTVDKFFGTNF